MFRFSLIDIASCVVLVSLFVMTAVFFACGDDDDDDASPAAEGCEEYLSRLNSCVESHYDLFWYWWVKDPYSSGGIYDDSFLSWCRGGVYDPGSPWGHYDFIPGCFEGSCDEINQRNGGWIPGDCIIIENLYG